jgi:hypothetical protein
MIDIHRESLCPVSVIVAAVTLCNEIRSLRCPMSELRRGTVDRLDS